MSKERGIVVVAWVALLCSIIAGLMSLGAILYSREGVDAQNRANELSKQNIEATKEMTTAIRSFTQMVNKK